MNRISFACGASLAALAAACAPENADTGASDAPAAPPAGDAIVLAGATILDGDGGPALADGVVIIEGDRIACVGTPEDCPAPAGAEMRDLSGKWVTPGLVDAHIHFAQTGWLDGRPDGIDVRPFYPYEETTEALRTNPHRFYRALLCSGVTAAYDVGGHQWTLRLGEAAEGDPTAVHVRAAGPLVTHAGRDILNTDEYQTFLPMDNAEVGRESVARLVEWGATAVKVWYLAPSDARRAELDAAIMAVGEAAAQAGLPLIVHATSLREAKVAIRAGAQMLVHSVFTEDIDQEFVDLVLDHDVIYTPTIVVGPNWTRATASVALGTPAEIDDPNSCVDPETRAKIANVAPLREFLDDPAAAAESARDRLAGIPDRLDQAKRNLKRLYDAGATIVMGTDAGNPMTLHGPSVYSEMEAMQDAGVPASDVLVMATRNGALAMGRLADFGTIAEGKIADLAILGADPTADIANFREIEAVIRAGSWRDLDDLTYRED